MYRTAGLLWWCIYIYTSVSSLMWFPLLIVTLYNELKWCYFIGAAYIYIVSLSIVFTLACKFPRLNDILHDAMQQLSSKAVTSIQNEIKYFFPKRHSWNEMWSDTHIQRNTFSQTVLIIIWQHHDQHLLSSRPQLWLHRMVWWSLCTLTLPRVKDFAS